MFVDIASPPTIQTNANPVVEINVVDPIEV
jgi:hypothetical protein